MTAVLTPTRRGLRRKVAAWFKAIYVRRLIKAAEFDIKGLEAELAALPERIAHHRGFVAEKRVQLAILEKS